MILEHYSAAALGNVQSRAQAPTQSPFDKPAGLWVSVRGDDDWPSWCRDADYAADRLGHCIRIDLAPDARLLLIDSGAGLDRLEADYGTRTDLPFIGIDFGPAIDWAAVARDWQGIVIAPYQWSARLKRHWYYGWDCASGCIWDAAAITKIKTRA